MFFHSEQHIVWPSFHSFWSLQSSYSKCKQPFRYSVSQVQLRVNHNSLFGAFVPELDTHLWLRGCQNFKMMLKEYLCAVQVSSLFGKSALFESTTTQLWESLDKGWGMRERTIDAHHFRSLKVSNAIDFNVMGVLCINLMRLFVHFVLVFVIDDLGQLGRQLHQWQRSGKWNE